jgi:hypothetical protein
MGNRRQAISATAAAIVGLFGVPHAAAQCTSAVLNPWENKGPHSVVGAAQSLGSYVQLTPAAEGQTGAVWASQPVKADGGFDCMFGFSMIGSGVFGPGDGLAFVLQSSPEGETALGLDGGGSGLGYAGICCGMAIEFDTFAFGGEFPSDHTSLQLADPNTGNLRAGDNFSHAHAQIPGDLNDENVHWAYIRYRPNNLRVQLDGDLLIDTFLSLADPPGGLILDPNTGCGYAGFTAATGGAWSEHNIERWSMGGSGDCVGMDFFDFIPDQTVNVGDRLMVRMSPTGSAPWSFEWRLDGQVLMDGDVISGTDTPFLIIDPVGPEHEGLYDYSASNDCSGIGTSFTLTVTGGPCFGDLDGDNVVGLADLAILIANFGLSPADPADGDLDDDDDVDLGDLALLLAAYGEPC